MFGKRETRQSKKRCDKKKVSKINFSPQSIWDLEKSSKKFFTKVDMRLRKIFKKFFSPQSIWDLEKFSKKIFHHSRYGT